MLVAFHPDHPLELCLPQSTVVNLIERFYDVNRGQILLDGTPLDAIDHECALPGQRNLYL